MIKESLIIGIAANKAAKIVRSYFILEMVLNGRRTLSARRTLKFIELLLNINGIYANKISNTIIKSNHSLQ